MASCLICTRQLEQDATACQWCQSRIDTMLIEIGYHYADLPEHLERGSGGGPRTSGSREAPLPLRVDPLDLSLRARKPVPVTGPLEDQIGYDSVLTVLDRWVRDWIAFRAMRERGPVQGGASMVTWLRNRLDWACLHHTAIADFDDEILDLRAALRRTLGLTGKPEFLDVPCRRCDWLSLLHVPRQDRVECAHCGDLSTGDEFHRWSGLLATGVWNGMVNIDLTKLLYVDEAALLVRVTADAVRKWASRGLLPVAERDHGRPRFTIAAVFEAERHTRSGLVAPLVDQVSH